MNPKVKTKFEHLNSRLEEVISYMDKISEEKIFQKPDGSWNAAQILRHLCDSEKGTTAYLSKKIQAPKSEVPSGGISAKIRSFLLRRALRNDAKKFKAPKFFEKLPEKPDYKACKDEYLQIRKSLSQVLEKFDGKMIGKAYFKHPRVGRINILQTLDFLQDHLDRHFKQIRERSA